MDPALADRLTKYLDTLEKSVATGADFVTEQAPLVAQELLRWEFTRACLISGTWLALAIIAFSVSRLLLKQFKEPLRDSAWREKYGLSNDPDEGWVVAACFAAVGGVVLMICFGAYASDARSPRA